MGGFLCLNEAVVSAAEEDEDGSSARPRDEAAAALPPGFHRWDQLRLPHQGKSAGRRRSALS